MNTSCTLFLQGQIGPFFGELAKALAAQGQAVRRIHFNAGDVRFWPLPGGVDFSAPAEQWPGFFRRYLDLWGVTDLILFGDCRPLHAAAIGIAQARGVRVHVFEEGYLRPDFITLETGGVNGHSSLPRDAESYLQSAAALPPWQPPQPVRASFAQRALHDLAYNFATALGAQRFPHYRSHRPWHPFTEYAVGSRRFPLKLVTAQRTSRQVRAIERGGRPYFVFPLQLDADSQIRFHAPPGGIAGAIRTVLLSFAEHAPAETLLVITEHPLDYGPQDQLAAARRLVAMLGLQERVTLLRGGSPMSLLRAARGLVTVNSTLGLSALAEGVPVIALGRAVYQVPGLTHAQGLSRFWRQPQPPEPTLFDAFRRVVRDRTQINGGFFSPEAIAMAVAGSLSRLQLLRAEQGAPASPVPAAVTASQPQPAPRGQTEPPAGQLAPL